MIRRIAGIWCGVLAFLAAGQAGWAEPNPPQALAPDVVAKGKKATALIEVSVGGQKGYASAFCVDAGGFFVTANHVVSGSARGAKLLLVLWPGESTEKAIEARVVRTDKDSDLALLRADKAEGLTALDLGGAEGLAETMPVFAFGYPFGKMLAGNRWEYPSITVTLGVVNSLRKIKGELQAIQLSSSLNPGNSGGPLLNDKGQVIGVTTAGILGPGVSFAVPVSKVRTLIEKPEITFEPPAVAYSDREKPRQFLIKVATLLQDRTPLTVVLVLNPGRAGECLLPAKAEGDAYKVSAVPVPPLARPKTLQVRAEFSSGTIIGRTSDCSVKLNKMTRKLSEIARIEQGEKKQVLLADGKREEGSVSGLDSIEVSLGEASVKVDVTKAARLTIDDLDAPPTSIPWKVVVKADGKVIGESEGSMAITGATAESPIKGLTPGGGPGAVTAPPIGESKVSIKLPAPFDDMVVGGGGRYLFLSLKKLRKIAVFDVNEAKITRYISVPSDNIMMAAGAEDLFVVLNEQNLLQK